MKNKLIFYCNNRYINILSFTDKKTIDFSCSLFAFNKKVSSFAIAPNEVNNMAVNKLIFKKFFIVISFKELIKSSFGSSFYYSKYVENANNKAHVWHYHPEIEMVFVNGGAGKRQIGSHVSYYTDGDLILIGSNLPHCGLPIRIPEIKMKPSFK